MSTLEFRLVTMIPTLPATMRRHRLPAAIAVYPAVSLPLLQSHSCFCGISLHGSFSFLTVRRNFSKESGAILAFLKASRTPPTPFIRVKTW